MNIQPPGTRINMSSEHMLMPQKATPCCDCSSVFLVGVSLPHVLVFVVGIGIAFQGSSS